MKLLYGVAGEGMGHATRSKVAITCLRARGHQVLVVSSGRAYRMLARSFPDVLPIHGMELAYHDGALDLVDSVARNARHAPAALAHNLGQFAHVDHFAPDAVLTDFEPFAHAYARLRGLLVVSVDNLHALTRLEHDSALWQRHPEAGPTASTVALLMHGCDHYVVTTFFWPPVRPECRDATTLVPPIVREAVVRARPRDGEHVLVYQTAAGDTRLLDALAAHPRQRFVVYGLGRVGQQGNVELKAFDERGFVDDLASARAVLANGGMSLMGECVYLGKPVYSVPVRAHFEQVVNAHYLAAMGYGVAAPAFDAATLGAFLRGAPAYAERLRATFRPDGNAALYGTLDRVVDMFRRCRA